MSLSPLPDRVKTGERDSAKDEDHQTEPTAGGISADQQARSTDSIDVDDMYTKFLEEGPLPMPFRILILGRANAGKTTILERITGGSEAEALVFRNGKLVQGQEVKGQCDRGEHSVEDEIIFPSRPGFIFHDSRGFEAGSEDELEKVHRFIEASPKTTDLRKQLHAIWMCLPLNEARDLFDSEKEVFRWSRGRTPLVVIFTKRDGAITKFQGEIIRNAPKGTTINRAFKKEALRQAEIKVNTYIQERKRTLGPKTSHDLDSDSDDSDSDDSDSDDYLESDLDTDDPQTIVFLTTSNMGDITNKTADTCNRLIEATENALSGPILQSSLCRAWGRNFESLAYWTFYE